MNNNTVNKNPIIQPVKREEKKTEQTTTSTTEKVRLNIRQIHLAMHHYQEGGLAM